MKKWGSVMQVSFTYIGTVVGAGFATGQEILQFFTRFGWAATVTIGITTLLFTWLGIKLMLLASRMNSRSYEDVNNLLFGPRIGSYVSLVTLISLLGVSTVMLAGGGSVLTEQLHIPYQAGLLVTLSAACLLLIRGMNAIMAVNSIVVPMMALFSLLNVWHASALPSAGNWLHLTTDFSPLRVWLSPFLYAAFNLAMAQAVLVPLGAAIKDRKVLLLGGLIGGATIGGMLLAAHIALSSQMPGIQQFDIPMGHLIGRAGGWLQGLFFLVIFGEIFTTLLANVYGLCLQLEQRLGIRYLIAMPLVLLTSYAGSQIGFKALVSSLYPLFGMLSMAWLVLLVFRRTDPLAPGDR
ncbi:Uncharacterized membrane protein YkvI [Paenibacillus sp. UNCCL117]|uniref:YkvI family membrane protein n=1 Tax=unclassified Paenibacillus TaxID=185978 RepID=UPI00088CC8B1|nr:MULTISPECIES: hypothetical protein [unclassified Paenibacillus]SDC24863.1 Uncharacterized membrane protein YkvI [Paenibacillus sp. cl123]SFW19686.1 Uncharacterized membrane protein YkvI [Paenibacillus sp. UNCCL117]